MTGNTSALQIIKYFSVPQAQISFLGDICIQFCFLYFYSFNLMVYVTFLSFKLQSLVLLHACNICS